jgi:hypothetical protein
MYYVFQLVIYTTEQILITVIYARFTIAILQLVSFFVSRFFSETKYVICVEHFHFSIQVEVLLP